MSHRWPSFKAITCMKIRSNRRKSIYAQEDVNDTTSKKQKSLDIQADLISDLPSAVLYKIVECLPLRDAARTSVLSHKWHQIWTSIPSLVFDEQCFGVSLEEKRILVHAFCGNVTKVLLQHQNPILKFSLSVPLLEFSWCSNKQCLDVTQWLSYLSRNGVRDFSLFNMHGGSIEISSLLYSCRGLEKLKLQGCTFSHLSNFRGLPKLTSLEIEYVKINYSTLNDLIGNCPALQNLVLQNCVLVKRRHLVIDDPNQTNLDDNVLDFNPDWTLNHLSYATLGILRASSIELKLIEYLLGCSPVLEKLSVSFNQPVEQGTYIKMLMLLNRFNRVSPRVKVMCERVSQEVKVMCVAYETSSSPSDSSPVDDYDSDST